LRAIDRGALSGPTGREVRITGTVAAVPRRTRGLVRVRVATAAGRVQVEAREPIPDLPVGAELRARGHLAPPPPWYAGYLRRYGIRQVLRAHRLTLTGGRRGGLAGTVDRVRERAEGALGVGVPARAAALARGFVLGQDDRIDSRTVDDFKRSGLAHLLAVSGQNVILLALLAMPLLAALGFGLRGRLLATLALIALYVPVTGAGPSIQRAGVMGAAGLLAGLAGRPSSRVYALLLAAFATLALNPRASGDVGWQLSFAAVVGIFLWTRGLRDAIVARIGEGSLRRGLAEGAAMTIAATLATVPLMAHHFEAVSVASLPANLLALPAVAPTMWLGMIVAMVGQLPGLPLEPLNWLNGLLVGHVAQVGRWLATPSWALAPLQLPSLISVVVAYGALLALVGAVLAWERRRRGLGSGAGRVQGRRALVAVAACAAALALMAGPAGGGSRPPDGLEVTVLDVGQGDAILLEPPDGDPVLVDGGPPGDGLRAKLAAEGVRRLGAVFVTHDQDDHAGGLRDVLGVVPARALLHALPSADLLAAARAGGAEPLRVAEGSEVRSGSLRVSVLWPPRALVEADQGASATGDPNQASLVLLARWKHFSILLTGDAEAEAAPIDPGPIDVLKVAHHGSDDAGLGTLLDRTAPRLAVISVGEGNPYGHPTPATIATLAGHRVPTLRTDRDGAVRLLADSGGWRVTG